MNYIYKTQKYKENINFIGGSLQDLFKKSKYVICGGPTSATIEALVYECQLLILNIDPYDSKYLETLKISKNMYKMLNNKNEFLKFFKELSKAMEEKYPDKKLVFVLDNLWAHKSSLIVDYIKFKKHLSLLLTPSNTP